MTNEDKIREILDKRSGYHITEGSDEWYTRNYQNRFSDLQEMAAWKEQQMIEWLEKHAGTYQRFDVTENKFYYSYNLMINDFKQAMKGE